MLSSPPQLEAPERHCAECRLQTPFVTPSVARSANSANPSMEWEEIRAAHLGPSGGEYLAISYPRGSCMRYPEWLHRLERTKQKDTVARRNFELHRKREMQQQRFGVDASDIRSIAYPQLYALTNK